MGFVTNVGRVVVSLTLFGAIGCRKEEGHSAAAPQEKASGPQHVKPGTQAASHKPATKVAPTPEPSATVTHYSSHGEFWTAFQEAVATDDPTQISQFINFPFRTKVLDGDAETEHDQESFAAIWVSLLESDPGMTVDPITMQKLIASTGAIPQAAVDMQAGIAFRVGNFEFAKAENGWHFVASYVAK